MKYRYTFYTQDNTKYELDCDLDAPLPLAVGTVINLQEILLMASEASDIEPILVHGVIDLIKVTLIPKFYILKHKKEYNMVTCHVDVVLKP